MMYSILSSESIKRSPIHLLISIFVPIFSMAIVGIGFAGNALGDEIEQTWETLLLQMNMVLLFFYPLGITLICSQLASVDHQANSWKFLLTLPLKKEYVYVGKLMYAIGYSALTVGILLVGSILLGIVLNVSPNESIPWVLIVKQTLYPIVAAFSILSFQLFLSLFFRNQAFPIIVGVVTAIFTYSLLIFPASVSRWLFWTYPTLASPLKPVFEDGAFGGVMVAGGTELYLLLGITIGFIISYVGTKWFATHDIN
ncbi:ABC transporter permease [Halalkalibacterium halodurans]|uniref:ABC transporter permease n=1 Tax=Halalkalibacterium halodurans TaxID=86665 RepID=UPI002E23EF52|nr:ABC transporter permease [Halalkalibacterium halodurans]